MQKGGGEIGIRANVLILLVMESAASKQKDEAAVLPRERKQTITPLVTGMYVR